MFVCLTKRFTSKFCTLFYIVGLKKDVLPNRFCVSTIRYDIFAKNSRQKDIGLVNCCCCNCCCCYRWCLRWTRKTLTLKRCSVPDLSLPCPWDVVSVGEGSLHWRALRSLRRPRGHDRTTQSVTGGSQVNHWGRVEIDWHLQLSFFGREVFIREARWRLTSFLSYSHALTIATVSLLVSLSPW